MAFFKAFRFCLDLIKNPSLNLTEKVVKSIFYYGGEIDQQIRANDKCNY